MFSRWPSLCLSVCLSVHSMYVHPSTLRFRLITSIYKWISFKFCLCICSNNVSLGIVNGQILQRKKNKNNKKKYWLTLKAPITTAADDSHKYFFIVFQRK